MASWKPIPVTSGHVRGAVRAYRRECLEHVLPLEERVGWDGIDGWKAAVEGWTTAMLPDLAFYHHRRSERATDLPRRGGGRKGKPRGSWVSLLSTFAALSPSRPPRSSGHRDVYELRRRGGAARGALSRSRMSGCYSPSSARRFVRWHVVTSIPAHCGYAESSLMRVSLLLPAPHRSEPDLPEPRGTRSRELLLLESTS